MAFFLAHAAPEIEILALTTVFGNGGTDTTTANALRLVETAGRPDIPVLRGADNPLLHPYDGRGAMVHGSDGLGTPHAPRRLQPAAGRAAHFIAERIMAAPGEITLVAVGPLTNLALAVSLKPGNHRGRAEVVIMAAPRPWPATPPRSRKPTSTTTPRPPGSCSRRAGPDHGGPGRHPGHDHVAGLPGRPLCRRQSGHRLHCPHRTLLPPVPHPAGGGRHLRPRFVRHHVCDRSHPSSRPGRLM